LVVHGVDGIDISAGGDGGSNHQFQLAAPATSSFLASSSIIELSYISFFSLNPLLHQH
jgi:hypothetical protein